MGYSYRRFHIEDSKSEFQIEIPNESRNERRNEISNKRTTLRVHTEYMSRLNFLSFVYVFIDRELFRVIRMSKNFLIFGMVILLSAWSLPARGDEFSGTNKEFDSGAGSVSSDSSSMSLPDSELPVKYIGNSQSHKFHRPSCPFARIMASNKRMQFYFRRQAVGCGQKPCRYCLPAVWQVVRARLLTPLDSDKAKSSQSVTAPP